MPNPREDELRGIVDAVARSVDTAKLAHELQGLTSPAAPLAPPLAPAALSPPPAPALSPPPSDLLSRLLLADILDDSILGARAGDKAYPLRLLFTFLGESVAANAAVDTALSLACSLNVYFRVVMDEEVKMRLGIETSRLYYQFCNERTLERDLVSQASKLLATLLSGELERVRFETVENAKVFDSQLHERTADSDPASAHVLGPASFSCRVAATNMLRARALVRT